jgi:hypothetical protein
MLFKKLFQILVVGGAVVGATSGCAPSASAAEKGKKEPAPDAGTPKADSSSSGGGVKGW